MDCVFGKHLDCGYITNICSTNFLTSKLICISYLSFGKKNELRLFFFKLTYNGLTSIITSEFDGEHKLIVDHITCGRLMLDEGLITGRTHGGSVPG